DRLNEKMVISTRGTLAGAAKREGRPAEVKMAPKVLGSWLHASAKLTGSVVTVTPMGMPSRLDTMMPIRMAALTLHTSRMMVRARPIRNSQKEGWFRVARAGTPELKVTMPTFRMPM